MSPIDPPAPDRAEGPADAPSFAPPDAPPSALPTPGGYPPPTTYPPAPGYPAPQPYPAPQGYPPAQGYPAAPGYPPAQSYPPAGDLPAAQPAYPVLGAELTGQQATPTAAPTERVARGLLFSLGGIVVGVVLTVVIWKLNFIASITSFAMAYVCSWLYVKGAGSPPRKGVGGLIAVIVAGVVISLASVVVVDALDYLGSEYPDATLSDKVGFVMDNLFRAEVWQSYTTEVLMYILFAALGTFGVIRQLGRAKGA